jgi:hypothetical protein
VAEKWGKIYLQSIEEGKIKPKRKKSSWKSN